MDSPFVLSKDGSLKELSSGVFVSGSSAKRNEVGVLTDLYSRPTCDPRQSDVLERLAGEACYLCAQAEAHDVQVAGVHGATVVQEVDEAREEASDG